MTVPRRSRGYLRTSGNYGRFGRGKELKFHDTAHGHVPSLLGFIQDSVNEVKQGTGENERIGRKITLRHIAIRGEILLDPTGPGATSGNRLRYVVYLDKQANGAAAVPGDIFSTSIGIAIDAQRNLSNTQRFSVLCDKTFDMNSLTIVSATDVPNRVLKTFGWSKSLNVAIEFSATTGDIAEIRSNNVGVLLIDSGGTQNMFVSYTVRVRYSDD